MNSAAKAASAARLTLSSGAPAKVAVGDVVGHRVIEQGDVLGHQGDVPAQVAQAVILDIHAIEQDLPSLVVGRSAGIRLARVDLPLPERPTRAIICPSAQQQKKYC